MARKSDTFITETGAIMRVRKLNLLLRDYWELNEEERKGFERVIKNPKYEAAWKEQLKKDDEKIINEKRPTLQRARKRNFHLHFCTSK